MRTFTVASVLALLTVASEASAVTYQVGPTRALRQLSAVAPMLNPGDLVEVDPGTYGAVRFTRAGAEAMPITIRGVRAADGARPVIDGGDNTVEFAGNHYVFEGFDVRNGARRCVFHHADNVVIRASVVHDCPQQGILGADQDSGDLLLDRVEVHHCGSGTQNHQIYMATDEVAYPGSVFRMQHCYVHDANGGNAVKSRAERNEIYYNWIEGALYHELELIGPDPAGAPAGWTEARAREDSDVVGNVLRATGTFFIVRVGGDGTGQSLGRYRFVNNTFVTNAGASAVMRVFDGLESIEMHNNVFFTTGGTLTVSRTVEARWTSGEVFEGSNNWVMMGAAAVPAGFRGTVSGADPQLANAAMFDLRPRAASPLIDRGVNATTSPAGRAFVRPLALPLSEPPRRAVAPAAIARAMAGTIDIGAYESVAAPADGSIATDASAPADSGVAEDSGVASDSGVVMDSGGPSDSGVVVADTGVVVDAAPASDSGSAPDGSAADGSAPVDGSTGPSASGGCGCAVASHTNSSNVAKSSVVFAAIAAVLARKRRRAAR